jgi:cbb3-type cytochrome oxidase subunit 3
MGGLLLTALFVLTATYGYRRRKRRLTQHVSNGIFSLTDFRLRGEGRK